MAYFNSEKSTKIKVETCLSVTITPAQWCTPKLAVFSQISHLSFSSLPAFSLLILGRKSWIIQWRPMGHVGQTLLSCDFEAKHCTWNLIKTGNTKRPLFRTALNWFVIKTPSLHRSGVVFSTVSLLMLLLHFTKRSITIVDQDRANLSLEKCLACMQNIYSSDRDTICLNE